MSGSKERQIFQLDLPVDLNIPAIIPRLRPPRGNGRFDGMIRETVDAALQAANPKAIYTVSTVRCLNREHVEIDGILFTSRVLGRLFSSGETVYPFIATVGQRLDELRYPPQEMLRNFALDSIKTIILVTAVEKLAAHLKEHYQLKGVAFMNPGELKDWPISEQKQLFALFSGAEKMIDVSLTTGGAMRPLKSRSGIIFPDETGFLSCRLCSQAACPGRRARYDEETARKFLE